jgi:hemolysin III
MIWGLDVCGILLKLFWMEAPRWISVALYLVYGLKCPNLVPGVFGFHELWHLFVVAGCSCHFWAVLYYVAPLA